MVATLVFMGAKKVGRNPQGEGVEDSVPLDQADALSLEK